MIRIRIKLSSSFLLSNFTFFFILALWIMIRIWLIVSWWSLCIVCTMWRKRCHMRDSVSRIEYHATFLLLRSDFFAEFLCYLSVPLSTRDEIWYFRADEWKISINVHSGLIRITLDFLFVIFITIISFLLFSFLSHFFEYYH